MKRSLIVVACLLGSMNSSVTLAGHGFWNLFDPDVRARTTEGHSIEARLEKFTDGSAIVWAPILDLEGRPIILKHTDSTGEEICRLFVPGTKYMGATIQANPLSPRINHSFGAAYASALDAEGKLGPIETNQWGFYGVRCQMPLSSEDRQMKITSIVSRDTASLLTLKTPWSNFRGTRIYLGADSETATALCKMYGYRRAANIESSKSEKSDVYLTLNGSGSVKSISNYRIDTKVTQVAKGKSEVTSTPDSHIAALTCWR